MKLCQRKQVICFKTLPEGCLGQGVERKGGVSFEKQELKAGLND